VVDSHYNDHTIFLVGGFNPSEKYESQTGLLFPIYGNIKNVPNHQPDHYNDHKISGSASGSRPNAMPSSACGFSES